MFRLTRFGDWRIKTRFPLLPNCLHLNQGWATVWLQRYWEVEQYVRGQGWTSQQIFWGCREDAEVYLAPQVKKDA